MCVACDADCRCATQEMLRDTARGGAGTNPMMSYITDAAPQQGEAAMRAGRHAEVSAAGPALRPCAPPVWVLAASLAEQDMPLSHLMAVYAVDDDEHHGCCDCSLQRL